MLKSNQIKSNQIKSNNLLIIILIIVLSSCSKSDVNITNDHVTVIEPSKNKATKKVIKFLSDIDEAALNSKIGENKVSVDEAVWLIEAALNYTNTEPFLEGENNLEMKMMFLSISPEDGELSMDVISTLYDSFQTFVNIDSSVDYLVGDVKYVETDGDKKLEYSMLALKPSDTNPVISGPIETEWDWNEVSTIVKTVNAEMGIGNNYMTTWQQGQYYTDVVDFFVPAFQYPGEDPFWDLMINPNDDVPEDANLDRFLPFRVGSGSIDLSLTEVQMDYYIFEGFPSAISVCESFLLSNIGLDELAFIGITEFNTFSTGGGLFGTVAFVNPTFRYGVLQQE